MLAKSTFCLTPARFVPLVLATMLAFALPAWAQQGSTSPIEQQMSAEEFRAAGLGQLSAEQLRNLNAWLNRTVADETAKAATTAEAKVKDESRGFLDFGTKDPIVGRLTDEFRGFAEGRQYTLENGQVWQQSDNASLAGVRLDRPAVSITPGMIGNVWYLKVEGYNTRAKVQRIK